MKVLFICEVNVSRSQMAEFFLKEYSKEHQVISAGTIAADFESDGKKLSQIAGFNDACQYSVDVMKEVDPDFYNKTSKQLNPEMVNWADRVIVMAERETWPEYLVKSNKVVFWDVPDGKDRDYNFICGIRETVKKSVECLVKEMG